MNENERIKQIRTCERLRLTAEKFGERLGVTRATISAVETGKNHVSDQLRRSICREFNVNENWLRNGEGEMFLPIDNEAEISAFLQKLPNNSFKKRFVSMLAMLNDSDWEALERMALLLQSEHNSKKEQKPL